MRRRAAAALLTACALLLGGCGEASAPQETVKSVERMQSVPVTAAVEGGYVAPPFVDAVFHDAAAEGNEIARLDLSSLEEGYVAVSATSAHRLKFQVIHGEEVYTYDLPSDGTPGIFPLSCGDGEYRFRVMENVTDKKYAEVYGCERNVTLLDEFQPFIRPNAYVPYNASSECVKKAAELSAGANSETEFVAAVYRYIGSSVKYDTHKAETVTSGYLPDPDETMRTGKGICFDYAALAASMLRSQGIPTKEIFGYVSPEGLYHAWNMFYTAESGWVTVSFETDKNDWNRLDMTFAANGADDKFIGDGSNYSDLYWY